MTPFAALLALGLCADPPAENKPVAGTDGVSPTADLIKLQADMKRALERLENIEKGLGAIENRCRQLVGDQGETIQRSINEINKSIRDMRFELDGLKLARTSTSEKRSEPSTTVGTATVMLVNLRIDMPMEAIVNGMTYIVEANQNRMVSVPAGALRVRVTATDAVARERSLAAGTTHVVTLK